MEKVFFYPCQKQGQVRVKYRIRDGRSVQVYYTTDILCKEKDLEKLNPDGTPKDRVKIYNTDLSDSLKKEHKLMMAAYVKMRNEGMDLTTGVLAREIKALKNPVVQTRKETQNIVEHFRSYADTSYRAGVISDGRYKHLIVVSEKLERFLIVKGISSITAKEFSVDNLYDFREFLFDEYLFVKEYPTLYKKVKPQNTPTERLSVNTVTSQLKMFQTFFNKLEDREEIRKSPFRKLGQDKSALMQTRENIAIFLRKDEFIRILKADVPVNLQGTKDAFLVQCAFGFRIGDFKSMGMAKVSVSEEGIPYIHYIPQKTANSQKDNKEIKTPIVRYAFDIIARTKFVFPVLKNVSGTYGFNAQIKALLQHCGINRPVEVYNERTKENDYLPLYKVASSKLARKTHVDMMRKYNLDEYVAGLHKEGSSAIKHYTDLEVKDRFVLMNTAFGQEPYKVDNKLVIIE